MAFCFCCGPAVGCQSDNGVKEFNDLPASKSSHAGDEALR